MLMNTKNDFDLTELDRRLANIIRLGRVAELNLNEHTPQCRVQIGELLTKALPIVSLRAGNDSHWWPPHIGEQVIVLSPSGDLAQGVVLGSIHQQAFPAPANTENVHCIRYSDGAQIEYDKQQHRLQVILPSGSTIECVSDGGLTIVGDVTVMGNITASENISDGTRSMQGDRAIYNQHTHPGDSGGVTQAPIQSQ